MAPSRSRNLAAAWLQTLLQSMCSPAGKLNAFTQHRPRLWLLLSSKYKILLLPSKTNWSIDVDNSQRCLSSFYSFDSVHGMSLIKWTKTRETCSRRNAVKYQYEYNQTYILWNTVSYNTKGSFIFVPNFGNIIMTVESHNESNEISSSFL